MRFRFQSARFKNGRTRWLVVVATFASLAFGAAQAAEEPATSSPPASAWCVVIAAKFALAQVTAPIPGAKDSAFAAAVRTSGGALRLMNRDEFAALGMDWAAFAAQSVPAASAGLASAEPELIRDRRGVIECVLLRSKRSGDDLTLAVLAPDFMKRFGPLLGSKILVAIPERQTVYLFPKLASRYGDYGDRILAIYHQSAFPVSREVFEVSAAGLRAVGAYEEP